MRVLALAEASPALAGLKKQPSGCFLRAAYQLCLLSFVVIPAAATGTVINQLALTGDPVVGAADAAEYSTFGFPSINDLGQVAFKAQLRTGSGAMVSFRNRRAIIGASGGAASPLGLIARDGESIPGAAIDEVYDLSFTNVQVTENGDVVFTTRVRPESSVMGRDNAVVGPANGAGSPLGVLARDGMRAQDGRVFIDRLIGPVLSTSGDILSFAQVRSATGVLRGFGLFSTNGGPGSPLSTIAIPGSAAPGIGGDALFAGSSNLNPKITSTGQISFVGALETGNGSDASEGNNDVLFGPLLGSDGKIGVVAREGMTAPGVADGAEFGRDSLDGPFRFFMEMNDIGDVIFQADLRTGIGSTVQESSDRGLFGPTNGPNSPLGLLAREGFEAPGATDGAVFDTFLGLSINTHGDTAFAARLRGNTPLPQGVVSEAAVFGPTRGIGSPSGLILRESGLDDVIGGADDAESSFFSFQQLILNDAGSLAFTANRAEVGTGRRLPGAGLFAYVNGELELIAREGDSFSVVEDGTDIEKVIAGIQFGGFNNLGQLAFSLSFDDGTGGVFIAQTQQIPEPNAAVVLLVLLTFRYGCRNRMQ